MERKSDAVRRLVAEGDYQSALRIAKDFRRGISQQDADDMKRGYEAMVFPRFYKSLGLDIAQLAQQGIQAVIRLYG